MDGQAESAPEAGSINDLASFLSGTPVTEPTDELEDNPADESTADGDTEEDANAETDEDDDEGDEPEESKESAPERKLKVTLKGDDGTSSTVSVPSSATQNRIGMSSGIQR